MNRGRTRIYITGDVPAFVRCLCELRQDENPGTSRVSRVAGVSGREQSADMDLDGLEGGPAMAEPADALVHEVELEEVEAGVLGRLGADHHLDRFAGRHAARQ